MTTYPEAIELMLTTLTSLTAQDRRNRYVVTVEYFDIDARPQDTRAKFMIDMYSAADAVEAVSVWLNRGGSRIGRSISRNVTHVEAYDVERHGLWHVEPQGPGRSR
jgi:hypothetical protein